jgi:hypothetical protein
MTAAHSLTSSEREWLRVRSYLQQHRYDLAVAASDDYAAQRIADTPLLADTQLRPASPIPIQDIRLELCTIAARAIPERLISAAASVLPTRADGAKYRTYSEAMRELSAPLIFENRLTYRLSEVDLVQPAQRLSFDLGMYFDGIDLGEAAAHQYAARKLGSRTPGVREAVGNPCDPRRRPMNLAISALTLRFDRAEGRATFLTHWRDPGKVGHAGGLYQVIPVGIFQPSADARWNVRNDFSLWRCIIREFAEELCGQPEGYGSELAAIDYETWPLARQMSDGLGSGLIRAWCLGVGVDPLTYATDLLAVLVIDSVLADRLHSAPPRLNAEGRVLSAQSFDAGTVDRFVSREPIQAAGAALLRLAWSHRGVILT